MKVVWSLHKQFSLALVYALLGGFIICFPALLSGCTEVFNPQISASNQILVVDGMITNAAETYMIKLSYASPYHSTTAVPPVPHAVVTVKDDAGNEYGFTDMGNGTYVSNTSVFTGVIGRTYTLLIKTSDGTTYQSAPQVMKQTFPIDSIYGTEVYVTGPGEMIRSFVNLNMPSGFTGFFRFTDSLFIIAMSANGYIITRYSGLDEVINLTDSGTYSTTSRIVDHELSSINMPGLFYGIPDTFEIIQRILNGRVYGINNDTYNIYNSMNGQLVTGTQLFDPIVTQVQGNMTCTSDPTRIVPGKFEASSYIHSSYEVVTDVVYGTVQYDSTFTHYPQVHYP